MTPERWQRIRAVLEEVEAAPAEQRGALLDRLCEGDADLRRKTEHLLFGDGEVAGLIHDAIGEQAASLSRPSTQERFGPYRIVRRIGAGGMGAVYEASRIHDFHKKVALKIIRQELDSDFARARFQQERQVLAALEHPYIARLLDGGESEDGSPYLVLEFVDGEPFQNYAAGLDQAGRLRLFLRVCEAVEYAHRNLVVHRDLKPGNILVTADGAPKLLDFGIAKLLDASATQTKPGYFGLTPDYASPEQVRGLPISTASDVYSLGVILYRLLTDRAPYSLETATPMEMDRVICKEPPPSPGLGDELDHIILMALRKEPERRYGSVQEFGEDVRRYLDHRPVSARPDTIRYRTGKFVRRRWPSLAATAAVLVAIAGGTAAAVQQARIARARFEQVRTLAHRFVFDFHDDIARLEGSTSVREKMVTTALEYLDNLSKSAAGDLELQKELAAAYQKVGNAQGYPASANLGHVDQAVASYRKAAAIHEKVVARDPRYRRDTGQFYTAFANLLRYEGDYEAASRMGESARRNLEQAARQSPDEPGIRRELAQTWCVLGDIDEEMSHKRAAYEKFHQCEAIAQDALRRFPGKESLESAQRASARVGTSAQSVGRLEEALRAFDEDERLLHELVKMEPANPVFHRAVAVLAQFRSTLYFDDDDPSMDDPARSLDYSRKYLDAARQMVERDPNNAAAGFSLAIARFRLSFPLKYSDAKAAVESARESLQWFDQQIAAGKGSYLVRSRRARALRRLSQALLAVGKPEEARAKALEAVSEERQIAARNAGDLREANLLSGALITSAEAVDALHDFAGGARFLTEAEQISSGIYARNPTELTSVIPVARVREALGEHWRKAGDQTQSRHWFDEARRVWREFPDQNDFVRRKSAGR